MCGKPCVQGLTHPVCKTKQSIDGCFTGVIYKGVVKKLLYAFKYKPYLANLSDYLAELLFESLIQNETYMHVYDVHKSVFAPIPLFAKKLRQRGYNQSLLLAQSLARLQQGSVKELLVRTKETNPQFGLTREERKANIKGAFTINNQYAKVNSQRSSIFLVDDVVTTGSTLVEAALVLKKSGYKDVYGITFAQD
jgi:ComF family protein